MSRILSGIRASGQMHLGHYLGAIKQWIDLQRDHDVFYMVADLHGITTPYDPKELPALVRNTVLDYLAAGLDPDRATIFIQSHIPAHSQLMWLLGTITPVGELQRMVQYKEWSEKYPQNLNAGILNYPILMAADILAYKPLAVPVGDDQDQHVELARDIAKKFNRLYGQTFPEPKSILAAGKRIMALDDPERKMSKSEGNGIGLNDSPAEIEKKMRKAVTSAEPRIIREAMHAAQAGEKTADIVSKVDPNQVKQFHGVRNLFTILFALADKPTQAAWQQAVEAGTLQFAEFKPALAKVIADHFESFRERRVKYAKDTATVDAIIAAGDAKANAVAEATLHEVQQKLGLR
ncbi:MAG: tryptophan--tRNA ligase [Candidatus Kerfeldbacteria bacterium]|nr:tryptophan--tRNA ligase [Candidatus Kerfeldbacteria bacterium]